MKIYPYKPHDGNWSIYIDCRPTRTDANAVEKIINYLTQEKSFFVKTGDTDGTCSFFALECQDAYASEEMIAKIITENVVPILAGLPGKFIKNISSPSPKSLFGEIQEEIDRQNLTSTRRLKPLEGVAAVSIVQGYLAREILLGKPSTEYRRFFIELAALCCRMID